MIVLPSLTINYLGQGALVLANPKAVESTFFLLYPDWALVPMVGLATVATVIASQAVITGACSVTRQARPSCVPRWQDRVFISLARSANDATDCFQIPTNRVVEVGTQVAT